MQKNNTVQQRNGTKKAKFWSRHLSFVSIATELPPIYKYISIFDYLNHIYTCIIVCTNQILQGTIELLVIVQNCNKHVIVSALLNFWKLSPFYFFVILGNKYVLWNKWNDNMRVFCIKNTKNIVYYRFYKKLVWNIQMHCLWAFN